MIADALALVGPMHQLAEVLSTEVIVPEPVRDVMKPVAQGLELAEKLSPSLLALADSGWNALSAVGASTSIAEMGRTITALADSAGEIGRVTARAADIVVRGTVEVIAIAEQFLTRAAAMGPALFTPPGQIALLGLASEHLTRGLQVVDRVRQELHTPTAELRRIAASIPDAPPTPGVLPPGPSGAAGAPHLASHVVARDAPDPAGVGATPATGGGLPPGSLGEGVTVQLPDGSTASAPNPVAARAVEFALGQQGVPYSWGGTTAGVGLDCSGLTQYAYREAGMELPRLAQEQGVGTPVAQSDLQPGDLAVWSGHVAMYIGNGQIVEAGDPVQVSSVRTDNIGQDFYGFYRPTSGTAT